MTQKEILRTVDHTLLKQTATPDQIRALIDDAARFETASICIPPCYVREAAAYAAGRVPVCTVTGFPNGNSTTETKVFETGDAIDNGAEEIDMVINLGLVKAGRYNEVLREIDAVKRACGGHILKVIIETCLLTDEEKIEMCRVVSDSAADYIKTSTGFSTGGATLHDIELFAAHIAAGKKIKAAGGISSFADAEQLLAAGASRLGTSRLVSLAKAGAEE